MSLRMEQRETEFYLDAFVLSRRKYRLHRIASNVERHHAAVSELETIAAQNGGTMKRKKMVPAKKQKPKARPKSGKEKGPEELMPLLTPATET